MAKCKFEYNESWFSGQDKEVKIEFNTEDDSKNNIHIIFTEFDNFLRSIGFNEEEIRRRHEAHSGECE